MTLLARFTFAYALAVVLWARSSHGADSDKVWAVAAFINNGERTPPGINSRTILTPEGARQMLRQGRAFRARYLTNVTSSDYDHIEPARVQNIDTVMIDNDVLDITSRTDEYFTGGAMAFFQGLYPPSVDALQNSSELIDMARDYSEGGENLTDYPLDGYQYANIRTLGVLDPMSTGLQGSLRCTDWEDEISANLTQNPIMLKLYNLTYEFYQDLFTSSPLEGTFELDEANLWNAYEIYDYVSYEYIHNETVFDGLTNGTDIIDKLNSFATTVERAQNAYWNGTESKEEEDKSVLYSISGRTLANRISRQFLNNVQWDGEQDKLALMFGSYEPIISLITLTGILNRNTTTNGPFSRLPEPGAALLFELIGEDPGSPDTMPSYENLGVRMYYRANADADEDFELQNLFGMDSDGGVVPFSTFTQIMQLIGVTAYEWCDVCGSTPAPWCNTFDEDEGDNDEQSTKNSIGPVIAGIIGAVIMSVIIAVIGGCLFCVGGLRLKREPVQEGPNDGAGGFKGPEKKDGDKDVAVTKDGFHHERVGSWELKNGTTLPVIQPVSDVVNDPPGDRRRSFDDDDDDISVMGATPVKEHESV